MAELVLGYKWLNSPFNEFIFDETLVRGVCRIQGKHLEILAIHSDYEGEGNFARFLDFALGIFETVTFLEVMNDRLESYLRSRGGRDVVVRVQFDDGQIDRSKAIRLEEKSCESP